MQCPICNASINLVRKANDVEFRKEKFKVFETYYECDNCKEKIVDIEMGDSSLNQIYNQYREKYNLMFPSEIIELREKYGFSKTKMSLALGWGENTYASYEKGAIPNESHNSLLRLIEEPTQFLKLIETRIHFFSKEELKELKIRINELNNTRKEVEWIDLVWPHKIRNDTGYMKPNFNKFIHMVLFFLNSDSVYKTKLNKLLFYADFLHYKLYCQGISGSRYRAIEFGPVPSEYDALYNWLFKKKFINIIENLEKWGVTENFQSRKEFDEKIFDEKEINTLRTIQDKFSKFTATELKDFSHNEKAWIENKDARKIISYQDYAFEICI